MAEQFKLNDSSFTLWVIWQAALQRNPGDPQIKNLRKEYEESIATGQDPRQYEALTRDIDPATLYVVRDDGVKLPIATPGIAIDEMRKAIVARVDAKFAAPLKQQELDRNTAAAQEARAKADAAVGPKGTAESERIVKRAEALGSIIALDQYAKYKTNPEQYMEDIHKEAMRKLLGSRSNLGGPKDEDIAKYKESHPDQPRGSLRSDNTGVTPGQNRQRSEAENLLRKGSEAGNLLRHEQ